MSSVNTIQTGGTVFGVGAIGATQSAASIGAAIQRGFEQVLGLTGTRVPSEIASFARHFAAKDAQGARVYADPNVQQAAMVGVALASTGRSTSWVSRSADQSRDVQYWVDVAQKDGLIKPMSDAYRGYVEAGVWYLDASPDAGHFTAGHGKRIDPGHNDQQVAGLAIIDAKLGKLTSPAYANAARAIAQIPGFSGWSTEAAEKLGAMLACTGTNVYVDAIIKDPQGSAKKIRDLVDAPCKFLDDAAERRKFADAVLVLKLADRSRGQAAAAAARGDDVRTVQVWASSRTVPAYREAVRGA